jgi:hypothetical protein
MTAAKIQSAVRTHPTALEGARAPGHISPPTPSYVHAREREPFTGEALSHPHIATARIADQAFPPAPERRRSGEERRHASDEAGDGGAHQPSRIGRHTTSLTPGRSVRNESELCGFVPCEGTVPGSNALCTSEQSGQRAQETARSLATLAVARHGARGIIGRA